ncbi:MAG: xylose isomerase [Bacteroides sp. SM23_62_1]|nr:MAG: xylose isomerase [Bacteroides sp. SM23_62_1]
MRLGGPLFTKYNNPGEWVNALTVLDYKAAYCPVDITAGEDEIRAYRNAAAKAGILISEVGVWNNPISPDETERTSAIDKCIKSLHLADEIGANCCVNISGSRNRDQWAGPHKNNLTDETFEMVVEITRNIIDAVHPTNTWFTLEAMPWAFPYSPDSYLRLIKAIDRQRFAVHLDPVNMVVSPEIYFNNGDMIKECFRKLGPHIKSCHAKDIFLREDIYTPHLDEVRPGLGALRYDIFLKELSKLKDIPLMMEHLNTQEEYDLAAEYIREVGRKNSITV